MSADAQKARDAATRVIAVCDVIAQIVSDGKDSFLAEVQAEMGFIRIGEGVAKIPVPLRERFAEQPWRQIIDMRNFAAHQCDDLDPHRVWRTLTVDVPRLRAYFAEVLIPGV